MILGEWKVNDVKPSVTGDAQEVKVKVRINHNGIILISSAQMVERKEVQEEQTTGAADAEPQSPTEPAAGQETATADPMDTNEVRELFKVTKMVVQYLTKEPSH